jgi:hypothetical protein
VVAADQRMVIRCLGDDLAVFVHDVSHVPSVSLLSAPLPEHSKTVAMMVERGLLQSGCAARRSG